MPYSDDVWKEEVAERDKAVEPPKNRDKPHEL